MKIFSYAFIIILAFVAASFAILNAHVVTINLYFLSKTVPLSLLLVFSFSIGMVFSLLISLPPQLRTRRRVYQMKNKLKMIEKELDTLRSAPARTHS